MAEHLLPSRNSFGYFLKNLFPQKYVATQIFFTMAEHLLPSRNSFGYFLKNIFPEKYFPTQIFFTMAEHLLSSRNSFGYFLFLCSLKIYWTRNVLLDPDYPWDPFWRYEISLTKWRELLGSVLQNFPKIMWADKSGLSSRRYRQQNYG